MNNAVDLLSRYIQLNTSNPPGNEHLAAAFFQRIFEAEGIEYRTYEKTRGRTSIRAVVRGTGKKKPVIIMHHMDVIAASRDEWSFDPFGGELIDGYVCGRGALDTKGLGIMQLLSLIELKKSGKKPDCDLIFLAAADEECGADHGIEFLLDSHGADFQAGLVLNEGGNIISGIVPDRLVAMISPGEKGPCWIRLTRKGVPGHGSTPHDQNPLEKLTKAVNRLLDYVPQPILTPIVREYFRHLAQGLDFFRPYAEDGKDETLLRILEETGISSLPQVKAMLRNTISLNSMHSGSKVNVIPSYAEAMIDTRVLPGQDPEEWAGLVKSLLADGEIEMQYNMKGAGNASDMDTDSYRTIEKVLQEHYPGCITAPFLMLGTTDSRYFRAKGMTSYCFCPAVVPNDHVKSVHGIDEKIAAQSLVKGAEVYADIVRNLCYA